MGTATIELKPGTQPGDVVVRRGQGIPRVGEQGRGDHHVQLRVEIPKKLTARQEELMRELATELGEGVREKRGLFGRKKS
jgi:molecular chaperone DnaJ